MPILFLRNYLEKQSHEESLFYLEIERHKICVDNRHCNEIIRDNGMGNVGA